MLQLSKNSAFMKDFAIIANGPFLVREILDEVIAHKIVIALDGAANKLKSLNIIPQVILGDFDSVDAETQAYWGITQTFNDMTNDAKPYQGNHGVLIVPAKDQNETDLVKAIHYCDQQSARSITLVCVNGGREDHHEGTRMALKSEYKPNRRMIVHTAEQSLQVAQNETVDIIGNAGDYCGFIATHTGLCSSQGLEYECNQLESSICNRLTSSSATLHIDGLALIILPPQLASQREYMKQSEVMQLELQLRDAQLAHG